VTTLEEYEKIEAERAEKMRLADNYTRLIEKQLKEREERIADAEGKYSSLCKLLASESADWVMENMKLRERLAEAESELAAERYSQKQIIGDRDAAESKLKVAVSALEEISAIDETKELRSLTGPTDFAESQTRGRALSFARKAARAALEKIRG